MLLGYCSFISTVQTRWYSLSYRNLPRKTIRFFFPIYTFKSIKPKILNSNCLWTNTSEIKCPVYPFAVLSSYSPLHLTAVWTCHVPCGLWIREWKWQSGTATVPRGTWCPSASAVSESASPKWKPWPKLTMTERKERQLSRDGDWTLSVVWSGATFTCSTEKNLQDVMEIHSVHKKGTLCKTALILLSSQQVPWV